MLRVGTLGATFRPGDIVDPLDHAKVEPEGGTDQQARFTASRLAEAVTLSRFGLVEPGR